MSSQQQLEEFLKSLTSNKKMVVSEIIKDISISTANTIAFSKIEQLLVDGKSINDEKFKIAIVRGLKKQCESQTRILHLLSILISSDDFDTQCRKLRMSFKSR